MDCEKSSTFTNLGNKIINHTMSTTLRDIVSELATDVHAYSLDDRISYRFLAGKFMGKLNYFLRLEAKSREFAKLQNLWQPIDCVELEEVNVGSCGFIDKCTILKRSKCKIPEAFGTNYGLLIKVFTVGVISTEFKIISNAGEYKDYINRRWAVNLHPAYIENKYLYIPDQDIQSVKILLIPINPFDIDKCNGKLTDCSNPLDATISYPQYLITLAKKEVLNELAGIYKHIIEDEKGDDNTNQKQ